MVSAYDSKAAPRSDGRVTLDAGLLKTLRKARGWSQEALADSFLRHRLPVSIASIKRAETGKAVLYRTARHLATIYEVKVEALVLRVAESRPALVPGLNGEPASGDGALRFVVQLHIELAVAPASGARSITIIDGLSKRYGGRIDTVEKQQVSCLFGLPRAYHSDADRAARAALEMACRLSACGGLCLVLRLVLWRDGAAIIDDHELPSPSDVDSALLSTPIFVASGLAPQLRARFNLRPCSQGASGYVALGAAIDERDALPVVLVGRMAELRQFEAVLGAARDSSSGQLVYLRGSAGIGKSHLVQRYIQQARGAGFGCHVVRVQDIGSDSWRAPLEQLARSLLGICEGALIKAEDTIDAAIVTLQLPADLSLFYRALTGVRMTSAQKSLYNAMTHAIREQRLATALDTLILRLSQCAPLLLTIEDMHWGSGCLFEAIGSLLPLSREAPLVWVLTSRHEDDPLETSLRPHLLNLAVTVFDLAPLAAQDALVLAGQYPGLNDDYRRRCVERAQGNALFLTQLLANPGEELPDSLKHLIQSRLDTLSHKHRRALRTASAIGNHFNLAFLREALDEPDYEFGAVDRSLLIRRVATDRYAFVHDLVMHCIYELMEPEQARQLHRRLAALYCDRDPELAAAHLSCACDSGTFDMMLRAVRAKLADHQYQDALNLVARCVAGDPARAGSFALALLESQANAGLGRTAQARERYECALGLAEQPQEKIEAVVGLAATLNILDRLDEEERLIDDILPLAHSVGAPSALGQLFYLKGNIYFPRGDHSACRHYHEEAVHYARLGNDIETEARALSGLGDASYAHGQMRRAHDMFSECIAKCVEQRFFSIEASNRAALGSTRIYLGRPGDALADALDSAAIALTVGNRRAEVFAHLTAGWVLCATGRLDAAQEQVEAGLDATRSISAARFEPFLMESQARIAWQRGRREEAERIMVAAAEFVEREHLQRYIGPWVLGTLALFSSSPVVRKKALLRGASYLTRNCLAHNAYRFHVSAAEVAVLDGDLVTADFHVDELDRCTEHESCDWLTHHASLIRTAAFWSAAPSAASGTELQRLLVQGEGYGFAYTMPKLYEHLSNVWKAPL